MLSPRLDDVVEHRTLVASAARRAGRRGARGQGVHRIPRRLRPRARRRHPSLPRGGHEGDARDAPRDLRPARALRAHRHRALGRVAPEDACRRSRRSCSRAASAHGASPGGCVVLRGGTALLARLGGLVAGALVTPLLLPWLPFRAFSAKGALVGAVFGGGADGARWESVGVSAALGCGLALVVDRVVRGDELHRDVTDHFAVGSGTRDAPCAAPGRSPAPLSRSCSGSCRRSSERSDA